MSSDLYTIENRRITLIRLTTIFLVALAAYDLWHAWQTNGSITGVLFWDVFFFYFYYTYYKNLASWIVRPVNRYPRSSEGRQTVLSVITSIIALLTLLIFVTAIGSTSGGNWLYMAVVPIFIVANWVLLSLLLGTTDRLPNGWETYWDRSLASPEHLDSRDKTALLLALLAVFSGSAMATYHSYHSFGASVLGWVILGVLLMDICVFGIFYIQFRNSKVWGLILIALWIWFNNFSAGLQVAFDLGFYFYWLFARLSEILTSFH